MSVAVRYPRVADDGLEPDDGELAVVRLGRELQVVHANEPDSVPQQSRHFQGEIAEVTFGQLFPRLLRGQRRQQGSKVLAVEVQPG